MAGGFDTGATYSLGTAFVFVFNLVIGVGALALPQGFLEAGLVSGILILLLVAFLSYIGISFIIETHAAAIAVQKIEDEGEAEPVTPGTRLVGSSHNIQSGDNELFEIDKRLELGAMSRIFLGDIGMKIFYLILVIYLFGDLAIYAAVVPSSIVKVICLNSTTCSASGMPWEYYVTLAVFAVLVVPWTFFNFQQTKYLQMCTLFLRNFALLCMIILSIVRMSHNDDEPNNTIKQDIVMFRYEQLPFLFGTSIYAFMCHHSLPSIVTPIDNKRHIFKMFFVDFTLIFIVYVVLCITADYAFGCGLTSAETKGVLTYQFIQLIPSAKSALKGLYYFLGLYPVFTLSTNYPLISITLRNNLMFLIPWGADGDERHQRRRQIIFSACASIPPIGIAFATNNVGYLVSYTGSYAGLGIMLVVPAILVLFARRKLSRVLPTSKNPYQSVFSHNFWVWLVLAASGIALVLITINHFINPADQCSSSSSTSS